MSTIIDTLITDRTQADVDAVTALNASGMASWTPAQVTAYLAGMKGAYNATDLNRVGEACAYLYAEIAKMGTFVSSFTPPKTDWNIDDVPTSAQMQTYLDNIQALKSTWHSIQEVPSSIKNLNYEDANNIEKLLIEIEQQMNRIKVIYLHSNMTFAICGLAFYPVTIPPLYPDDDVYPELSLYPSR